MHDNLLLMFSESVSFVLNLLEIIKYLNIDKVTDILWAVFLITINMFSLLLATVTTYMDIRLELYLDWWRGAKWLP